MLIPAKKGGRSILLFSPFFFPEPISTGKYNSSLVEALISHGHHVTVVCSHPFYPAWKTVYSSDKMPGAEIMRGGAWLRYPENLWLRRILLELWYAMFAAACGWKLRKKVDVVVAIFPPSLFFVVVSAILPRTVRRIGIVHDLQGVHADSKRGFVSRIVGKMITLVEKRSFNACSRLLVLSKAMGLEMRQKLDVPMDKLIVRYPFANLQGNADSDTLAAMFPVGFTHVVYAGALGEKQHPSGLAAFIEQAAQASPTVFFNVFSEGPWFEWLKTELGGRGLANVSFNSLVPASALAELYKRADIQLIPQADGTGIGSMPSKLPNILVSGSLVFAICEPGSELADIVREFDGGMVSSSWDPALLCEDLRALCIRHEASPRKQEISGRIRQAFSLDGLVDDIVAE